MTQLIHTMIRVLDPDRSIDFYTRLGFEERRRARVGGDTATIIMMGLPGDDEPRLELTVNDGRTEPYAQGEGYGHIALAIADIDVWLAEMTPKGIHLEKEPYAAYPGGPRIAFVRDPDDYRIEIIERPEGMPH